MKIIALSCFLSLLFIACNHSNSTENSAYQQTPQVYISDSLLGAWTHLIPGDEQQFEGFILEPNGKVQGINQDTNFYTKWSLSGDSILIKTKNFYNQESKDKLYKVLSLDDKHLILEIGDSTHRYNRNNQKIFPKTNIAPDQAISSPLTLEVKSLGIWTVHEGELGYAKLFAEDGTELSSKPAILTVADEDNWMRPGSVAFQTQLTFDSKNYKEAKLVIYHNTATRTEKDAGAQKSFMIPVRLE